MPTIWPSSPLFFNFIFGSIYMNIIMYFNYLNEKGTQNV